MQSIETKNHGQEAANAAVGSVIMERIRQDAKWGQQDHDAGTWALILLEEIGEWARGELEARFGKPEEKATHLEEAHTEAIHTAAVALAVVECMNRRKLNPLPPSEWRNR